MVADETDGRGDYILYDISLRMLTIFGFLVSIAPFIGDPVQGFPTLVILILFLGGIQLLSIGIRVYCQEI